MNDKEAIRLLRDTFESEFNLGKFSNFLGELFNGFYPQEKSFGVHSEYAEKISSIKKIGNYRDKQREMEIFIVRLRKGVSLDRARTMQRNVIAKLLKQSNKDSSLVAFISEDTPDWRFSFIKMDYKLTEEGNVSEELTPAKRYSFLVGPNEPNHTCGSQFKDLIKNESQKPTIEEIENAFSIEKVTKEFFEKYKSLYHNLKKNLDNLLKKDKFLKEEFEDKQISSVDFAKKLLGQIVFLYFLQKKGWLGVKKGEKGKFEKWGTGSRRFIQYLFEKSKEEKKNFFNDYLEHLFYSALATDRRADDDYYGRFDCKIPFLNGGLFEPLNEYNWRETDIILDNSIFESIFETFDEFNFTIKEDEPLEKEVAVDPEMLGKVFENLLDVEDRKSKGAFYTPREIVHYMCQQSLINYLETNTNILRKDLEFFIQKGDLALEYLRRLEFGKYVDKEFVLPESISKNAKELDKLLVEIKICDPAVGSGAFPVGMMNEIIKARTILTYILKKPKTDYELKRETIENSLYGVDIEPSAVEITKLRFWLSLIVDEEDMNNIKPLPNLENKIMCGNSLIEEFEGIKLYIDPQEIKQKTETQATLDQTIEKKVKKSEQKLKELRAKQKEFFDSENRTHKNKLREEIDKIEWDFIEETLREQGDGENMKKLKEYKKKKAKPFFLWKLYFSDVFHRDNPGFDVVIANPPYVGEKGHKEIFREIKETSFGKRFYKRKMDLFYFFFHKALDISKEKASVALITTNYFITADGAINLRKDFQSRATIQTIINFNELKIFDTARGQHNMITILKKGKEDCLSKLTVVKREGNSDNFILENILYGKDKNTLYLEKLNKELYDGEQRYIRLGGNSKEEFIKENILNKIKINNPILGNIKNVNQGLLTGADKLTEKHLLKFKNLDFKKGEGIYILSNEEINKLNLSKNEFRLIKPFYKNSDIFRFYTNEKKEKNLIYLTRNLKIEDFPNINSHINKFEKVIKSRSKERGEMQAALKLGKWWVVFATRNNVSFEDEKIVCPQRSPKNTFAYNRVPWYASADVYFITNKNEKKIDLKYLLALLNSTLYYFWLYFCGKRKGHLLELLYQPLSEIPIKNISQEKQKPFIEIVDKILEITKDEDYLKNPEKQAKVKAYEKRIDKMVYALYDLTPEEIKIIEEFGK